MSVQRSALGVERSGEAGRAVFLSYASQDIEAARRICDALRAAGIEVWFDQSELRGGDSWDSKIRQQIRDCAQFVPIISANTQARREGYFRIEWKLAAQRTHAMAEGTPFLLPIVVDDTPEPRALVPAEFREVQWTRLPDGAGIDRFCSRAQALLASESFSSAPFHAGSSSPPGGTDSHSTKPRSRNRASRPVAIALLLTAAAIALAFWRPWARPGIGAPPTSQNSTQTETQRRIAKARALFQQSDDLNRESYFLAEDIIKGAIALDVTDGEAWAAYAQLSVEFYRYGFDRTTARIEAMRTQAERALQLASDSVQAQVAIAEASDYLGLDQAQTTAKLRALSERVPNHWQVLHALGRKLGRAGKIDESLTALARADELAGNNPSLWADAAAYLIASGRYAEAEIATAKSLARRPNLRALAYNAILNLCWRGDRAAAIAGVESWPTWAFIEDRGCALAGLVWLWCRQPEKALGIYRQMPRDYLRDQFFTGPRAALTAIAHTQAGHREAARADWEIALRVADRELASAPGDAVALYWKAWASSQLGELTTATSIAQQLEQRNWMPPSYFAPEAKAAGLALALGQREDALRFLERDVTGSESEQTGVFRNAFVNFRLTRAVLELNPLFDPLREEPRFQRLLERVPAPRGATPVTRALEVERNSIAVLPFANRSEDRVTEYFSDGVSEELLNVLGKVPGLQVAGWTSALSFKGKDANPNDIREKLRVAYFVDGSVRKAGSRVQIRARLTRTDNNQQVWSDTYEEELKDIFALQDKIARDVAEKLQLKLAPTASRTKTVNPEAHAAVLEGRHFFAPRSYEGFDRSEAAFQRALRIDPDFAEARGGLGMLWITRAGYSELDGRSPGDLAARGIAESKRAIELDPNLPDGHEALGYAALWAGEFAQAEKHLRTALGLNPNSPGVRFNLGLAMSNMGRLDESIAAHQRAASLDPLGWMNLQNLARSLTWAQQYRDAHELNERAAAIRGTELFIPNRGEKALLEFELGHIEAAVTAARDLRNNLELYPRWQLDSIAVGVLWQAGHKQEALDYAAELFKKWPADHYQRGFVLNALDRFEEALPFLERTPAQPVRYLFWDKRWDRRREDPRFVGLIAKLGRTEEYRTARETLARLQKEQASKK